MVLADPLGDVLLGDLESALNKLEKLRNKALEVNNTYLLEAVDTWRPIVFRMYKNLNELLDELQKRPYAAEFTACKLVLDLDKIMQRDAYRRDSFISGYLFRLFIRIREYARTICSNEIH